MYFSRWWAIVVRLYGIYNRDPYTYPLKPACAPWKQCSRGSALGFYHGGDHHDKPANHRDKLLCPCFFGRVLTLRWI